MDFSQGAFLVRWASSKAVQRAKFLAQRASHLSPTWGPWPLSSVSFSVHRKGSSSSSLSYSEPSVVAPGNWSWRKHSGTASQFSSTGVGTLWAAQLGLPEAGRRRKFTLFPLNTPIIVLPLHKPTLSSWVFPIGLLKSWLRESGWILMTILTVRSLESLSLPSSYSLDL